MKFVLKSDINPEDIKYFMTIESWTPRKLKIKVNMTDPTIISKGMERDTIYLKIKNSDMYRSAESGLSMEKDLI